MELIKTAAAEYTAKISPLYKETTDAFIAGAEFLEAKLTPFYEWLCMNYIRVHGGWYHKYSPQTSEYLKTTDALKKHWLETYDGK